MKSQAILLLLLTSAASLYSQDKASESSTPGFKRVQIGINVSPDICYRKLKNTDGSATNDAIISLKNKGETVKVGYTAGLNVCYNFNKKVGIETGLQYSNKGYQTKWKEYIFAQPDPVAPKKGKFVYNYHYIDIPVKVNFAFGKKKVRFFTSVGLTTNIFIKETKTGVLVYSDRTDRKTEATGFDYNKVNISPSVSAGIDYRINDRHHLRIEPTFRYGVLKIIEEPVTGYLYSGGVNIGYYFGI